MSVKGSIEMHHITELGKSHHCIVWNIEELYMIRSKGEIRSPGFSIPKRDKCTWYLSLECTSKDFSSNTTLYSVRLVLDRKSECEKAFATFKLSIFDINKQHACHLGCSNTFIFNTKSENSAGILASNDFKDLRSTTDGYDKILTIFCDMIIGTTFLEDNSFSNDIGSLLETQLHTDVVISVGEKNHPVHKVMLAARSSVFAAMFAHNMKENEGVVRIEDINEDVVQEMLRYIYTGEVVRLRRLAKDLFLAADKYDLKGLRIKCEETLSASLSSFNAFDLLLFADLYNANELKSEAIDFITIRSKKLTKTSTWESLRQSNPELVGEIADAFLHPKFTAAESK